MEWLEIELILDRDAVLSEAVSSYLFDLGAQGIQEDEIEKDHALRLRAFLEVALPFDTAPLVSHFNSLSAVLPSARHIQVRTRAVPKENWAERYKEFYKAQKLTDLFFLKPAWDKVTQVPPDYITLTLDPGQAFGTGLHASTQLALRLMQSKLLGSFGEEIHRILDVGTGSGILAIAAAKLKARDVVAEDIDPIAIEVAKENAVLNGCPNIQWSTEPIGSWAGTFDLVVSNILLETHKQLASEYKKLVRPGGTLILAGLLVPQQQEMLEALRPQGFQVQRSSAMQEWLGLSLERYAD